MVRLKLKESQKIEFKSSLSEIEEIIETISAFSNTKGGKIYVGVADNGIINGVMIGKGSLERLANNIKQNTDPKIFPTIEEENKGSKTIIKIFVPECPIKPVWARDKVFIRVGRTNQKVTAEKIRTLIRRNTPFNWDNQLFPQIDISEINKKAVKSFVKQLKEERNTEIENGTNLKTNLKRLNLIRGNKLTYASILLFGDHPQKYFPRSVIKCARFEGNKPINFVDMKEIEGTIINQVPLVLQFINRHINVSVKISGKPQREEIWEIPKEALREAVINAICHRSYEDTGNVQIRIFDDKLEIWNPGTLPEGITISSLKRDHRSLPRNELIARCFYLIKYIEQWGTGTNRIINLSKAADLKEPKFEIKNGDFVVTFYRSSEKEQLVTLPFKLNVSQKKIVRYLLKKESAKSSEIQNNVGLAIQVVRRNLKELSPILIWTGQSKTDPTGEYSLRKNIDIDKVLK